MYIFNEANCLHHTWKTSSVAFKKMCVLILTVSFWWMGNSLGAKCAPVYLFQEKTETIQSNSDYSWNDCYINWWTSCICRFQVFLLLLKIWFCATSKLRLTGGQTLLITTENVFAVGPLWIKLSVRKIWVASLGFILKLSRRDNTIT